jgi:hypothetical protein
MYFDVLGCLGAHDYILLQVIGMRPDRVLHEHDVDVFIRAYGLMCGKHMVDALLDYFQAPQAIPQNLREVDLKDLPRLLLHLRVRSAILARCLETRDVPFADLARLNEMLEGSDQHTSASSNQAHISAQPFQATSVGTCALTEPVAEGPSLPVVRAAIEVVARFTELYVAQTRRAS